MIWAVAMVVSGLATSYLGMLLARAGLGVATATTGPAVGPLLIAGVLALIGLRAYPRDVATAAASAMAIGRHGDPEDKHPA